MWKGVREFFLYTRKQRNGIYILVAVVGILWSLLLFDDIFYSPEKQNFSQFREYVKQWERKDSIARYEKTVFTPFYFDPNTAGDSVLAALNLTRRQIRTLNNYRSKGGKFRKASDLARIYGIDSAWFDKVRSFIVIRQLHKATDQYSAHNFSFTEFDPNTVSRQSLEKMGLYRWQAQRIITYREKVSPFRSRHQLYSVYGLDSALVKEIAPYIEIDTGLLPVPQKERRKIVVELNSADTADLLSVRGIGPAFTKRILRYREQLGGFFNKEQLLEVYGIDSSRYLTLAGQIKVDETQLKKINVNTASFEKLLAHPYLDYRVVRNIVNFREKRRPYRNLQEIRNIELVDDVLFSKIAKYLTTEPEEVR